MQAKINNILEWFKERAVLYTSRYSALLKNGASFCDRKFKSQDTINKEHELVNENFKTSNGLFYEHLEFSAKAALARDTKYAYTTNRRKIWKEAREKNMVNHARLLKLFVQHNTPIKLKFETNEGPEIKNI